MVGLVVTDMVSELDIVTEPVRLAVSESLGVIDAVTLEELNGLKEADTLAELLGVSDPEGLTELVGLKEAVTLREPVGLIEADTLGEPDSVVDKGIRSYEIEKIGSPFAFGAIGTAVGKIIVKVEFCWTVSPAKSRYCH
jgi:hypothetical protein